MKLTTITSGLAALAAATLASANRRTATIFIQPIITTTTTTSPGGSPPAPAPLATLEYDTAAAPKLSSSSFSSSASADASSSPADAGDASRPGGEIEILSYEAPDLPASASLVRVGVWDAAAGRWASGTTVASAENFAKGYAPTIAVVVTTTVAPRSSNNNNNNDDDKGGGGEEDIVSVAVKGVAVDAGYTRDFGPKAVLLRAEPGRQVDLNRPVVLGPEGRKVEPEPEKSLLQKYWWVIAVVVLLTMTGGGEGGK